MTILPLQLHAAQLKARPPAGIGLVRIPLQHAAQTKLAFYREPGVGRVATASIAELPMLQQLSSPGEYCYLPVTARKRGWLKIIYDDSERDGWAENRSGWAFIGWEEFLSGRSVSMLKGLRRDYYQLRRDPQLSAELLDSIEKQPALVVLQMEGDWMLVAAGQKATGWLRWRDDNGRLQVQPFL